MNERHTLGWRRSYQREDERRDLSCLPRLSHFQGKRSPSSREKKEISRCRPFRLKHTGMQRWRGGLFLTAQVTFINSSEQAKQSCKSCWLINQSMDNWKASFCDSFLSDPEVADGCNAVWQATSGSGVGQMSWPPLGRLTAEDWRGAWI